MIEFTKEELEWILDVIKSIYGDCQVNEMDLPLSCKTHFIKVKSIKNKIEAHEKSQILYSEWGGSMRCMTSDGRNVNMADELNKLEKEKIEAENE